MATPTSSNNLSTHNSSAVKVSIGRPPIQHDTPSQIAINQGRQGEPTNASIGKQDDTTQGMSRTSQVGSIVVKPVDRKTIEGSTPGDHRSAPGDTVKATLDKIASPPAPREQMRGQQNTKFYNPDGTAFKSNEFASAEAK